MAGRGSGLPSPAARAHDGRRCDRDERAGQGIGVHGAPAELRGCAGLGMGVSKRLLHFAFLYQMCSSLGPTRCANETPRVHIAARRRGCVAARGAGSRRHHGRLTRWQTLDFRRDNDTVEVIGLPIEFKRGTNVKSKVGG